METELKNLIASLFKRYGEHTNIKIKYPNVAFKKTNLEYYIDLSFMPVDPEVITVCDGGSIYQWIVQASVYYIDGVGEIGASTHVDNLRNLLKVAHKLKGSHHTYTVMQPARAVPPIETAGWFFIPVQFRLQTIC